MAPHMPYVYVPDADWNQFSFKLHMLTAGTNDTPIKCSYMENYCRWETKCENVKTSAELLKITLGKGDSTFTLKLNHPKVPGEVFGQNNFCYLPVFMSKLTSHKAR